MFGVILISAVTVMQVYVLWRAGSAIFLRRRTPGKKLVIPGVLLWALFLVGRFYGHNNSGILATALELAGMTWMAVLFVITVPLLAVDVITGFGMLMPRIAPRMRGAAIILGLVFSVIALIQGIRQPVVRNYEVQLAGLPPGLDGTVIAGLSDLHLGSVRNEGWLRERVSQVQAGKPDIIVLLGDIFEGHGLPSKELVAGLEGLKAPMGVWAVLGNHEFHGRGNGIVPLFKEAGVTVLRNETVTVLPGLMLSGVDDLTSNHRSGSNADLISRTLASKSSGATVLLSHTPWNADRAAKAGGGLMLSGHTHGGQIWPFGYIVKRFYPLLAGRYEVDGMTVIVSRGAGSWGPLMRLWHPAEIIRVTLRARKV